jgi:hypothetical protein
MKACIDSIVIKLKSRSTYLEELHTILEQMRQAKKKNPKYTSGMKARNFLGLVIYQLGIELDSNKA